MASKPWQGAGYLDPGVGDPVRDVPPLGDHALDVGGDDLDGDGAVDDVGDLPDGGLVGLAVADALGGGEGRIGGDAADDAQARAVADFLDISRV